MKDKLGNILAAFWLAFSTQAQTGDSPAEYSLEQCRSRYQALCEESVARIQSVRTESSVLDVYPVYFAGWIHATNAIPVLLDIVELPGLNEPGRRKIAKRIPGSNINPIALSYPVPPPTPASGALVHLPVGLDMLTNLIVEASTNTNRSQTLAWTALARYGRDFSPILEDLSQSQQEPWTWIQGIRTNEWETAPSVWLFNYRNGYPVEPCREYVQIFNRLRTLASQAESAQDEDTLNLCKSALLEIGHPYDEDPSLWPR